VQKIVPRLNSNNKCKPATKTKKVVHSSRFKTMVVNTITINIPIKNLEVSNGLDKILIKLIKTLRKGVTITNL
jgi:hypothetical protein